MSDPDVSIVRLSEIPAVGTRVLHRWHLPTMLDDPILHHHDWQQARVEPQEAAITCFANWLSHRNGFGCEPEEFDALADPAASELGLDARWLEQVDAQASELFEVARKILG